MSEQIGGSPLQAAIDFDRGGSIYAPTYLPLPSHIRKLRRVLRAFSAEGHRVGAPYVEGVAASLAIAGSLYDLKADTAIDDSSISWCGSAMDYADAESLIAARYLAATIMFNFVWMALEEAISVATPPFKGTPGARGRHVFAQGIETRLDLDKCLKLTWSLTEASGDMSNDLDVLREIFPGSPREETAFELVRRIRNAFAHGDLKPPAPQDWGQGTTTPPSPEVDRFFAATRLALLLIAMLLAKASGSLIFELDYEDRIYRDEEDDYIDVAPARWSLMTAHLADAGVPSDG